MKPTFIVIDGKTYKSVNDMPQDVRLKYEQAMGSLKDQAQNQTPTALESGNLFGDKNNNGIPDVFENAFSASDMMSSMKIMVDGKQVNSVDDLPPEARAKYDRAMSGLDANKNGIPDFMEGMMGAPQQASSVSTGFEAAAATPRSQPLVDSPTITPDTSNGWMLALLGILLLVVCAFGALGVWYFFIR
jgi:hypothetical protein